MISIRRRKGFFTVLLLTSCFIYFNWFLNISMWKGNDKQLQQKQANGLQSIIGKKEKSINKRQDSKNGYELEENDENAADDEVDSHAAKKTQRKNNPFKYITVKSLFSKQGSSNIVDTSANNSNTFDSIHNLNINEIKKLNKEEMRLFWDVLYKNRAFLIDVELLGSLQTYDSLKSSESLHQSDNNLPIGISNFYKLDKYISYEENNEKNKRVHISFGVYISTFSELNRVSLIFNIFFNTFLDLMSAKRYL
jgi:hypothetical protein